MKSCPLCGGASNVVCEHETSVTSGSRLLEARSTLHSCASCGHAFTHADVDWNAYYAGEYDSVLTDGGMDEIVSTKDGVVAFRTDVDYALFRSLVGARLEETTSIIEFGCGRGRILSRLVKDGFRNLDAFDLSELYREPVARIVGPEHVHIGERPRGTWDLAISFFVLEHDVDPVSSLRWIRSVLKPNGHLFLTLPNPTTNLGDFACADHAHHYFPDVLVSLALSCGFVDVQIDTSSTGATALIARAAGEPRAMSPSPDHVAQAQAGLAPYRAFKERLDRLANRVDAKRPLYLYGAGFYATMAAAELRRAGISIAGVFDANPHKHGLERIGSIVADPRGIPQGSFGDATLLVCVNERALPVVRDAWAKYFAATVAL